LSISPITVQKEEVKWLKCGLCGKEVNEQPKITAEGKCSVCGAKLKPA
jgi:DNA-directed RNA polymerase subunit RPC12/RpoP